MTFKASRHAKRRMKLYEIDESLVEKIVLNSELSPGNHEIVEPLDGWNYPIKAVYVVENEQVTLVTAFPVKKRRSP